MEGKNIKNNLLADVTSLKFYQHRSRSAETYMLLLGHLRSYSNAGDNSPLWLGKLPLSSTTITYVWQHTRTLSFTFSTFHFPGGISCCCCDGVDPLTATLLPVYYALSSPILPGVSSIISSPTSNLAIQSCNNPPRTFGPTFADQLKLTFLEEQQPRKIPFSFCVMTGSITTTCRERMTHTHFSSRRTNESKVKTKDTREKSTAA